MKSARKLSAKLSDSRCCLVLWSAWASSPPPCAGRGVLRGHHGQRFESWHPSQPFCHPDQGDQLGGGWRHGLHRRRNLLPQRRLHILEERNLGYQPHQVLGRSGRETGFDFSKVNGSPEGFTVSGSWLHFKGIEICNLPVNSGVIGINNAHDDIMELMNTHHTQATGIFISHGSGGHLFLNCDSHDNYDPSSAQGDGQNADGFGVHYQAAGDGTSTTIRGCRAWWNSDDGYDFINQEVPVTIENSWSFGNGFSNYGAGRPAAGNGNGFKIGSSKTGIRHLVQNNVAWGNKANGFYANHSSGGNTWYNNTSFQNGTQFNMLASTWSEPNGGGTRTDGVTLTGRRPTY